MMIRNILFYFLIGSAPVMAKDTIGCCRSQLPRAYFRIIDPALKDTDTVQVSWYRNVAGLAAPIDPEIKMVKPQDGSIFFTVDSLDKAVYLSVIHKAAGTGKNRNIIPFYLIEPGDSIILNSGANGQEFSGRGSARFLMQQALAGMQNYGEKMKLLNSFRDKISPHVYRIMEMNIKGTEYWGRARTLLSEYKQGQISRAEAEEKLSGWDAEVFTSEVPEMAVKYQAYLLERSFARQALMERHDSLYVCKDIEASFQGGIKDKLMFLFIKREFDRLEDSLTRKLIADISDASLRNHLLAYGSALRKGKKAIDFALPDVSNRMVRLSDYKGKVVFIDFWFTGCKGCIIYYRDVVSKVEPAFRGNKDVVFISVSIDRSRNAWLKSVYGADKKGGVYTSPEVVNLYTSGQGSQHEVISNYQIGGYPRPLLIGRDGRIYSADARILRDGGPESLRNIILEAIEEKL